VRLRNGLQAGLWGGRAGVLGLAALVTAAAGAGSAQEVPGGAGVHDAGRGILSYTFENDTFAGTDRYYSAGNRLSWQSADGAPVGLDALGRALAPVLLPRGPVQWGVGISQQIFTARRKTLEDPPHNDRPYAGYLYGSLSLHAMDERSLGTIELSLGVIGPDSGAEQIQDGVHEILGKGSPEGWRHQISNQFAGMLTVERRWRFDRQISESGLEMGLVPAMGVNLGNLQTSAAVGVLGRFGRDLSMDFGPPRIRPALSGLGVFRPPEGLAWNLFAGLEGRAIAYDASLDCNRRGYWRVDKEPLVAELPFGFEIGYGRTRLSFAGVLQTKTFQSQANQPFAFGSISLSIRL
jgi:lipid A 3-O-deacylase